MLRSSAASDSLHLIPSTVTGGWGSGQWQRQFLFVQDSSVWELKTCVYNALNGRWPWHLTIFLACSGKILITNNSTWVISAFLCGLNNSVNQNVNEARHGGKLLLSQHGRGPRERGGSLSSSLLPQHTWGWPGLPKILSQKQQMKQKSTIPLKKTQLKERETNQSHCDHVSSPQAAKLKTNTLQGQCFPMGTEKRI